MLFADDGRTVDRQGAMMLGANMLSMSTLSLYRNAVQFGMSIVITTFIGPAEYGLVVFSLPFVALIAMLTDLGMSSAITRAKDLTREEAGAAFTLMMVTGTVMATVLASAAWPLGTILKMPGLSGIMAGMSIAVILTVSATTPRALLERRLEYRTIAGIEALAVMIASVTGLLSAFGGAGPWSLVIYNVVNHGLRTGSFLWLARTDMKPNLNWRPLRQLVSFGGWVLANNLLNFAARNSDNLLIGSALGAAAVGLYGLAYQFMLVPLMAITWPASGVLLATLRQHAIDADRAQTMIEGVMAATAMITFPAMAFLTFGLAFPVEALLSPRWHEVPLIVAWLAPVGALQSIASYSGVVLLTAGRARLQFLFTILNTAALVGTFIATLPFGLFALVRGYAVSSSLLSLVFLSVIVSLTRMSWRRLLVILAPGIFATTCGIAIAAALTGLHAASWLQWGKIVILYGATVIGIYALLAGKLRNTLQVLVAREA